MLAPGILAPLVSWTRPRSVPRGFCAYNVAVKSVRVAQSSTAKDASNKLSRIWRAVERIQVPRKSLRVAEPQVKSPRRKVARPTLEQEIVTPHRSLATL